MITDDIALALTPACAPASPEAPCQLRLTACGLTADGRPSDIPTAVARCRTAPRTDIVVSPGAPAVVYAQLITALAHAGVTVSPRRNGKGSTRGPKQHPDDPGAVDIAAFASTVTRMASVILANPTTDGLARGRFGERKVFIAAIRRLLSASFEYAHLSRGAVDALLVESMRQRRIKLTRADLAAPLDPQEVRDSELETDTDTFHFVIAELLVPRLHRLFMLITFPNSGTPVTRWFRAEPPVTWTTARDRLVEADAIDVYTWSLIADPDDYDDDADVPVEPLP